MLKFGVFDHVDYNGKALGEQLEDRLKLVALLEAEGYDIYQVAEVVRKWFRPQEWPLVIVGPIGDSRGELEKLGFGPVQEVGGGAVP